MVHFRWLSKKVGKFWNKSVSQAENGPIWMLRVRNPCISLTFGEFPFPHFQPLLLPPFPSLGYSTYRILWLPRDMANLGTVMGPDFGQFCHRVIVIISQKHCNKKWFIIGGWVKRWNKISFTGCKWSNFNASVSETVYLILFWWVFFPHFQPLLLPPLPSLG